MKRLWSALLGPDSGAAGEVKVVQTRIGAVFTGMKLLVKDDPGSTVLEELLFGNEKILFARLPDDHVYVLSPHEPSSAVLVSATVRFVKDATWWAELLVEIEV